LRQRQFSGDFRTQVGFIQSIIVILSEKIFAGIGIYKIDPDGFINEMHVDKSGLYKFFSVSFPRHSPFETKWNTATIMARQIFDVFILSSTACGPEVRAIFLVSVPFLFHFRQAGKTRRIWQAYRRHY
jgi:hypothetical protein